MTQLTDSLYAVEVPEGVPVIIEDDILKVGEHVTYLTPPGNWRILCTTREVTEEQAMGIVQIISNGRISGMPQYRRYDRDLTKDMPARCWTRDSRHSLETLITSKGLDINKNYCLPEKCNNEK